MAPAKDAAQSLAETLGDYLEESPFQWSTRGELSEQYQGMRQVYACDLTTPCTTDFRPYEHFKRTTNVVPANCPSGCANHGASYGQGNAGAKAAILDMSVGQWMSRKPSFSNGATSVKRMWQKLGQTSGNPTTIPLWRRHPMYRPAPGEGLKPNEGTSGGAGASGDWSAEGAPDPGGAVKPADQYEFPDWEPKRYTRTPTKTAAKGARVPPQKPVKVDHKEAPDASFKVRRVPKAMVAALKFFHSLTELQDAVDALVDALGGDTSQGLAQKMAYLAANWYRLAQPMTFSHAVRNLLVNEVEDRAIGALLGSNWRSGVRDFNDQYGTSVYVDASASGAFSRPYMSGM